MLMTVLAVKDRAAEAFARPMFVPSAGVGVRAFSDEVNRNNEENQMYAHPDDFDLYDIGIFDDSTGLFQLHDFPKVLARGKDVKVRD